MMPDYKGNDVTKSDMYTQELLTQKNNEYIAASGARSEASKAAMEALEAKNAAKNSTIVDFPSPVPISQNIPPYG